ncbi:cyanophycin synthetase [Tellurirhabdus bombi]|uniref:cyanophycin synthetase n=1 Tax=Tellurirhabdus bombi TaxID=2907205 RepID=UPI001F3A0E9C|nr:cyanophycin synthetase [Tellurirhabdus bombi]
MKLLEIRVLQGPNYWSIRHPKLVAMQLDLEDLEERPTNLIDGFYERIQALLPTLHSHECSEGHPGGFFFRVKTGTWMGHVIEHIALEIQTLAGMEVGFGRTRGAGPVGVYNVVFAYQEEQAGRFAAEAAVRIAQALIDAQPYDLQQDIDELKRLCEAERLGPSTSAIVEACARKGIPHIRLDDDFYIQLGYGARQKRILGSISSQTSSIAVDIACDKAETKRTLDQAGIPIAVGTVVQHENELPEAIEQVGFPLVIKPLDGNHGRGVSTNVQNADEVRHAFHTAQTCSNSRRVIIEQFISGHDYRLLVVNYKFCAAALRKPASVTGDGQSTLAALIEQANSDPRRGNGHTNLLTKIEIDDCTKHILIQNNLTLEAVLPAGQVLELKKTANLSTGGTAVDVTDLIHPEIAFMAERVARAVGLDICGIDLMAKDISLSLKKSGATVIEVNASPGLRMHLAPTEGKARDVGQAIADMLFPEGQNARIPLVTVTGTNGKTTTTRLAAHLIRQKGYRVGYTTTDGIYIDDFCIEEGDCTGPGSTRKILQDSLVEAAVLECARGGMLRSGLAFDQCDVAIVTNVAADHLGLKGIQTVEDMAKVKAVLPETVKPDGYAVLNADNDHTYAMRERLSCQIALFSLHPNNERILAHCQQGGLAAILENGYITLVSGSDRILLEQVNNIPLAFGGNAPFMIENILAATLGAYCQQVSVEQLAQGLRTFIPSASNTPGRMNLFQFNDFTILVDYSHNPHGLSALGAYLNQTTATRKVGIVAAGLFDEIIIRLDEDLRGRSEENIVELIQQGISAARVAKPTVVIPEELKALDYAIRHAQAGSLIVHLTEKISKSIEIISGFMELEENYSDEQILDGV